MIPTATNSAVNPQLDKAQQIINLAGYDEDGIADGPGLRCVVFVQGCPHHCPGCHNPQTWDFNGGTPVTVQELFDRIRANPLNSGVTLSGGEPFAQPGPLATLAEMLHPYYDIASYTGYTWEGLMRLAQTNPDVIRLIQNIDIIVDGPFIEAHKDRLLLFRGSLNQRILDAKASLASGMATWTTDHNWIGPDGSAYAER